jgi:hypothetical protein
VTANEREIIPEREQPCGWRGSVRHGYHGESRRGRSNPRRATPDGRQARRYMPLYRHLHRPGLGGTIQEAFVADRGDLLSTDLALFSRKLANWLVFYNA